MQTKSLWLVSILFAGVALASPWYPTTSTVTETVTVSPPALTEISQCNPKNLQCCNSIQNADSSSVATELGMLGLALEGIDALVGLGCTPISVVGVLSGDSCSQQAACCTGDSFNGLVNIGCTPINL